MGFLHAVGLFGFVFGPCIAAYNGSQLSKERVRPRLKAEMAVAFLVSQIVKLLLVATFVADLDASERAGALGLSDASAFAGSGAARRAAAPGQDIFRHLLQGSLNVVDLAVLFRFISMRNDLTRTSKIMFAALSWLICELVTSYGYMLLKTMWGADFSSSNMGAAVIANCRILQVFAASFALYLWNRPDARALLGAAYLAVPVTLVFYCYAQIPLRDYIGDVFAGASWGPIVSGIGSAGLALCIMYVLFSRYDARKAEAAK